MDNRVTHTKTLQKRHPASISGSFLRRRIPGKVVNNFTRDLSIMLNARMMLVDSIRILSQQTSNNAFRHILEQTGRRLQSGTSLADCLRNYPKVFSSFYVNLVEVGELSGKLDEMLSRVAAYLEKMSDLKRKLIQALTYPALVIGVAVLSLSFIMLYVIPTFENIFRDFNSQLPVPTLVVMSISGFIQTYLLHILLILAALLLLVKYSKSFERIRILADSLILHIPLLGEMIRKNHISQFCRTLGTLLESGISLLAALEIASKSTRNFHIRQDILNMKYFATKGEKLTRSLRRSKIFPLMVTQMIAVGEETAELPFMLIKIADFYDKEIDSAIDTLASVIEPVVIVLLGVIIGAILVSIYLPLFNMTNVMSG
ncbi:MAG: type II secretion system F family protein [Gammaproteobacteria bacterium]|nr:type II secretion system F family protein [candidate division Zixibacteria bacterium]NIR94891.1 type II secretion system F family protein [Gammaproteobacteria bacterium]NIT59525.1 type II secretion system F family protein [Fodinibius sp.]NIS47529.1 type II secretion system F family protein [candidate division Zixibacteria bacterium]NIU15626.1 type II secretion system F family protein [candidate division Zixibacteria bacterium]